jgi:hypothetical protein
MPSFAGTKEQRIIYSFDSKAPDMLKMRGKGLFIEE